MAGDRRMRQWIAMAANEQHIMPTLEGGLDFKKNMTEAMDGYAGIEHTLPIAPLYKDVVQLFAQRWHDVDADAHRAVRRPVGGELLVREQRRRERPEAQALHAARRRRAQGAAPSRWWAPAQWSFQLFAEQAAKVVAAGGRVGMGSHGQMQGLGAQWEMWNIASGGMPKHDVLRVATIFGAEAIGLEKESARSRQGSSRTCRCSTRIRSTTSGTRTRFVT